jgi:hypothetical protein
MYLFRRCQAGINKLEASYDLFPSGYLASFLVGAEDVCLVVVALLAYFGLCCGISMRRSSSFVSVGCSI